MQGLSGICTLFRFRVFLFPFLECPAQHSTALHSTAVLAGTAWSVALAQSGQQECWGKSSMSTARGCGFSLPPSPEHISPTLPPSDLTLYAICFSESSVQYGQVHLCAAPSQQISCHIGWLFLGTEPRLGSTPSAHHPAIFFPVKTAEAAHSGRLTFTHLISQHVDSNPAGNSHKVRVLLARAAAKLQVFMVCYAYSLRQEKAVSIFWDCGFRPKYLTMVRRP